ncbi:hypothetical protein N8838_01360 [Flavobacteriales bacterium]|nr:hypothetical protein [Flavobacteriales bacterium]
MNYLFFLLFILSNFSAFAQGSYDWNEHNNAMDSIDWGNAFYGILILVFIVWIINNVSEILNKFSADKKSNEKSSGNKNKKISLHISKAKIKAFIICVGLSFITHLSLNIIYGDYDVEKHIKASILNAEWKESEERRIQDEAREKWCKENPPRDDESTSIAIKRIFSGCDESSYIGDIYISNKDHFNNLNNIAPRYYNSGKDFFIKSITFNPFYGKEYYKKYAGEKFIYANYMRDENQWNSVAKGEFIWMCSLYNLHLTLFFGFMLFIIFLGIKFLITNFQLKLKD